MKAIYRTTFELRPSPGSADVFDTFSEHAWRWVYDRKEISLKNRPATPGGPISIPGFAPHANARLESLAVDSGSERAWGVVYSHPDWKTEELIWTSDLALLRTCEGKHFFSFSQFLGRHDGGMMPVIRHPRRPRLIRAIVREFPAYSGGLRLWAKPFPLRESDDEIQRFISLLESPRRTHPVVLVSVHEQSKSYFIDPHELADQLSGIAHVIVAANTQAAHTLSRLLPRWFTCFDGAVRVYWPGFRRGSANVDHRLWTVEDLSKIQFNSERFADLVLATIAEVSVNSISPNYCSFDRLQSLDRRRVIAQAKDNQDWKSLADTYAADCDAKDARLAALERELKQTSEALFHERQRTVALKAALVERKTGAHGDTEQPLPIDNVAEAIERAQSQHAEKIAFALNGRSEEDSPFDSPEEVWLAFQWLATTYYNAKMKIASCADFSASIATAISGWDYSPHQKEATMKANEEWYRCSYNGGRPWIPEHLKSGSSRNASESIRIAFCWDEETKKVVIGYIGLHQKNTKT